MKIVTVQEMIQIEQDAVERGISLEQLQRNAAAAIAREIDGRFESHRGPAVFLVGPGNNGRDGLIAADLLRERGWRIRAFLAPRVGSEDVLARLREGGAEVQAYSDDGDLSVLRRWFQDASTVVDALLGIGVRGAARGPMGGIIEAANEESGAAGVPVLAVDLPSGIDADTGVVPGPAIRADMTVSLGCVKAGLLRLPAAGCVGELIPVEIGLPPESCRPVRAELLTAEEVGAILPARPLDAHKGTFGHVLVVAGSRGFVGAGYFVGAAAARSGCGIVTFAVPEWQRTPLAALLPEATYLPLLDHGDAESGQANAQDIAEALPDFAALAIGPGLGQGPGQSRLVMGVLDAARSLGKLPTVVDADALNALSQEDDWWDWIGPGHVLTPHPGELSRLISLSTAEVNADRWVVAREAAIRWGQTVVLKGAFSVVADPRGDVWVNSAALPALATGGTGDVLTGLIAGLMGQGMDPTAAARAAVFLHAEAARQVLSDLGTDTLLASDLLPAIPVVMAALRHKAQGTRHK